MKKFITIQVILCIVIIKLYSQSYFFTSGFSLERTDIASYYKRNIEFAKEMNFEELYQSFIDYSSYPTIWSPGLFIGIERHKKNLYYGVTYRHYATFNYHTKDDIAQEYLRNELNYTLGANLKAYRKFFIYPYLGVRLGRYHFYTFKLNSVPINEGIRVSGPFSINPELGVGIGINMNNLSISTDISISPFSTIEFDLVPINFGYTIDWGLKFRFKL